MYLTTNLFTGKYLYDARISKKWNENIPSWMLRVVMPFKNGDSVWISIKLLQMNR